MIVTFVTFFCAIIIIVEKTKKSQRKDKLARSGKIFVKMPSKNYRQSSGVEYRGEWMTAQEYRQWLRRCEFIEAAEEKAGD